MSPHARPQPTLAGPRLDLRPFRADDAPAVLALAGAREVAEMGDWIGAPFRNRGYAAEAAALLLRFGFGEMGLNRVHARHLTRNPRSGRVMRKVGMRHAGRLRQHVRRWGRFEDLEQYGILRDEWASACVPDGRGS